MRIKIDNVHEKVSVNWELYKYSLLFPHSQKMGEMITVTNILRHIIESKVFLIAYT